ncbi:endonuclease/exonuclease/phosphatase family protein [Nioella nitratireducens]|uniref:endonuclease/exonuclease/phosphatase family protein n=1 Tax=Nioella nitratireducens TaxID=1287720 RepID=UPI0008FD6067|nr:endonuclease/exonuclease/phosphatase family protein [Nioella nitratireducens]
MRIVSFNIQNLRLRHPDGVARLDGARDRDEVGEPETLDAADRRLAAALLATSDADLVVLQEVFDSETLDWFNRHVLPKAGLRPYPYAVCLPGNDGRGLDIAVLSRRAVRVTSHAALTEAELGVRSDTPDLPVFRRDCVEIEIGQIIVFACHFKAPHPDPSAAWPVRRLEAAAVRALVERRFSQPEQGLWLILGDLNEPWDADATPAIAPLLPPFSVDLMARLPESDRWTYYDFHSDRYGQPDALLAAPALATRWPDSVPVVLRSGLGFEATRHRAGHLPGVGRHRPHASDHAALLLSLPGA